MNKETYFGHEAKTLVELSRQSPNLIEAREQLKPPFSYYDFLNLSYLHRVLPLVFHHINSDSELADSFPTTVKEFGRTTAKAQKYRTNSLLNHAKDVFRELLNDGTRFMLFRGLLLATTVYNDPSWRNFEDIDLLVNKHDIVRVDKVLRDLGYVQGKFDLTTKEIIPYTSAELDFWRRERQHLGSYLLATDEPFTAAVKVDLHYKLTNIHDPFIIDGKDLLERARKTQLLGAEVEAIDVNDLLMLLCVHIHSHYRWLYEVRDHNDLHLSRFTDLFEVVSKYQSLIDWDLLIQRTKKFDVEFPVTLGFFWATKLFGEFIPRQVLSVLKPKDFDVREKETPLCDADKKIVKWEEDFVERLFNPQRYQRMIKMCGLKKEPDEKLIGLSHWHF